VVVAGLHDHDVIAVDKVDQPMLLADAPEASRRTHGIVEPPSGIWALSVSEDVPV
jgi:hypothetical protein